MHSNRSRHDDFMELFQLATQNILLDSTNIDEMALYLQESGAFKTDELLCLKKH